MTQINEGKACDAVIRRIEAREGNSRYDLSLPERERHEAPIEVACRIGEKLFAFEHTRIEPFDGHIQLRGDALAHFRPIEERLAVILPQTEALHLILPARATRINPAIGGPETILDLRGDGDEIDRITGADRRALSVAPSSIRPRITDAFATRNPVVEQPNP
jgi:hypothetical protein